MKLNRVRAGIVKDPKEYWWSGYGEAEGGGVQAREGLADVIGGLYGRMMSWREVARVLYWPGSLDAPQESKRGKIATEE